jgi:hypothetical protein
LVWFSCPSGEGASFPYSPPSPSHGDYYLSLRPLVEKEGKDRNLYILYSAYTVDLTLNFELVKKETKVNSLKKVF